MFDIFNIKNQKLVVTNSSSTTTLESQNEQLNIGIEIDITAQKSIESIVDENNVICDLRTLITGPVRPILKVSINIGKLSLSNVNLNYIILLQSYLLTKFGTQNRAFNDRHYKTYEWLEYSISKDSIFCFACRNFNTGNSGNSEDSFLVGFKNWKKCKCFVALYLYLIH